MCLLTVPARADFAADLARIHIEASGGRARLDALNGLVAYGVTRNENGERKLVLLAERPNRVCVEVSAAGRTIGQGWDGKGTPWISDSATGRVTWLSGDAAQAFKAEAEFDDPLVAGPDRKVALDYVGEVTEGEVEWLKLVVTQNFTETSFVYLDPSTYLIVRRDVVRRVQGKEVVLRTDYSDFRPVAGVILPHRWVIMQDGKQLRETVIDRMEANPVIPARVFAPSPTGGR
ncbi:MAG: hypothetical protein H2171_00945 [Opitutus sp.]|nr:hypothetical protein [Opitutus sp.]